MTVNSLSVFSRVRLYTAIYLEGDVVDNTENLLSRTIEDAHDFPVLSLREIPLKRLPTVNPLRYQSPIALILGARLNEDPATIAQWICDHDRARINQHSGEDQTESEMLLSYTYPGWITLTWNDEAMYRSVKQLCHIHKLRFSFPGPEAPFWLWQLEQRSKTLIEQLQILFPEIDRSTNLNLCTWPSSVQALLEAIVTFFDRLSDFNSFDDRILLQQYELLNRCFKRMTQEIPLFSPQISELDRSAVFQVLRCLEAIIENYHA